VVTELAEFGADAAAVLGGLLEGMAPALATGGVELTTEAILAVLPEGIDPDAVAALETLATALGHLPAGVRVVFDPTLVRGMGYYTSTIYEIAHPESGSSIGGGGRYDGMIGRFLGQDVPAVGFSLGFERIIDLLPAAASTSTGVVLIHEPVLENADDALAALMAIKAELVAQGNRVRLERRVKNLTPVLDRAKLSGFTSFAFVAAGDLTLADITLKTLD
jgi:histidyl-tRNA synthetase